MARRLHAATGRSFPGKAQDGLTLPELLIGLAVISTVSLGATASLSHLIQQGRMTGEVNGFVSALQLARSQAVKHGQRIVLCPTTAGHRCGDSTEWIHGWMLFASDDREREPDEPVLQHGTPLQADILMRSGNHRKRIVYQPDGSSGGSNSSFTFCDRRNRARPRVICLSNTGRPRLTQTRCDGSPVVCG